MDRHLHRADLGHLARSLQCPQPDVAQADGADHTLAAQPLERSGARGDRYARIRRVQQIHVDAPERRQAALAVLVELPLRAHRDPAAAGPRHAAVAVGGEAPAAQDGEDPAAEPDRVGLPQEDPAAYERRSKASMADSKRTWRFWISARRICRSAASSTCVRPPAPA